MRVRSAEHPVFQLLPPVCREVQAGCSAHQADFLHLEVAIIPRKEAGDGLGGKVGLVGKTALICSLPLVSLTYGRCR